MSTGFEKLLTEDQIALRDMCREFAQKVVKPACREAEINAEIPWDVLKQGQEMGLHLLTIPEEYGGMGMDMQTYVILREELAKGDAGFAATLASPGLTPILIGGTEEQKRMAVDIVVNGGFISNAITEPNSGSDAASLRTTATRDGDDYILNGGKCFISHGGIAKMVTVFATVDRELRHKGVTAFMVPADTPGFVVVGHENKMGQRTTNVATLAFDDLRIPAKYRLGEEGEGFKIMMKSLDKLRPAAGSASVGVAQQALDEAVEYAKQRVVGGHHIWEYQQISAMLADMEIQIEVARQMVWSVARLVDAGIYDRRLFAVSKTFASDTAMKVTTDAVQIFGGYGYMKDYPVEKLMRDAKVFQIFEGTNQIQRNIISKDMLK